MPDAFCKGNRETPFNFHSENEMAFHAIRESKSDAFNQ
jgi:hypothetical protein